ncbi:Lipopolysaccharide core biosynthesis glycosyltransferase WaaE [Chlamydiales bacterium SCGC AG-110-M15]|nr:Lipopolysaccharide core biosynthesis glycosyltransferase WaaE [Chlamydiales bacterium SCGC AG-110-M15]
MSISVTILTKNSEQYLAEVLESVSSFDEVILLDNGSTDSTFEVAEGFSNVVVHRTTFDGFGPMHNRAIDLAKNDWILSIDSDEVLSKELQEEIKEISKDDGAVYSFPVHNYFNGKWIRWCGWYPDRHVRLFNRKKTRFTDVQVHEGVITDGMKTCLLNNPVRHYSYSCTADFLRKMQVYSDLFAEQNVGKKKSSLLKAITHGLGGFLKSYIIKKGFMGGYEGFVISAYNGHTAYYKYLKLLEKNRQL